MHPKPWILFPDAGPPLPGFTPRPGFEPGPAPPPTFNIKFPLSTIKDQLAIHNQSTSRISTGISHARRMKKAMERWHRFIARAHFRLRHPRQQSFSISGVSERGWRFRLQKLEDLRPPASTGVERVYTEKNRHSESVPDGG